MSYHIYKTKGFVLGNRNVDDSNKYFYIFTRELGMIYGKAQSVRDIKSKLKGNLIDFSFSSVSLVRGKNLWRITSAECEYNLYRECENDKEKIIFIARVFDLLRRFIPEQEKNSELFEILLNAFNYLKDNNLSKDNLKNFECVLLLRIFNNLGYIENFSGIEKLINDDWGETLFSDVKIQNKPIIQAINKAMRESHL
ncbi:MAG: DNA repair protein RecO [Candidatus Paceibacterota bacterium]